MKCRRFAALFLLATGALGLSAAWSPAAENAARDTDNPDYWKAAQAELARVGDGFLVWESYRTGIWRM